MDEAYADDGLFFRSARGSPILTHTYTYMY